MKSKLILSLVLALSGDCHAQARPLSKPMINPINHHT
jgi:hypothetical protein